jgi:hypothetical protein
MANFEKISSLSPIPSGWPGAQRLPQRKPREDRPKLPSNRQPHEHEQASDDDEGIHIDEYA